METPRRPPTPSYRIIGQGEWEPRIDPRCRAATGRYDCRASLGPGRGRVYCHKPAAIEFNRYRNDWAGGYRDNWYGYCAAHAAEMFVWAEAGQAWHWVWVKTEERTSK